MAYICRHCHRTSHSARDTTERYCGACHLFEDDIRMFLELSKVRSAFDVVGVDDRVVYIADRNDRHPAKPSVTNDVEQVVQFLHFVHPRHRVMYQDTDQRWDEILHDGSTFIGFAPAAPPQNDAIRERAAA